MAGALSREERRLFLPAADEILGRLPLTLEWTSPTAAGETWESLNPEILLTAWSTAPLPADWLASATCALRYVCHLNGSVRKIVPRAFIARGGLVTNWGDIPSCAVAEQALLLALAALRNLGRWPAAERQLHDTVGRIEELETRSLFGRRMGIHGCGRVARALVPLLAPFGGAISIYSAGVAGAAMRATGAAPCDSLEALFAQSEILFECEGLTPATAGSVTAEILARLPLGAVFVNVGRGQLVDEAALLREVAEGRLRVALDVMAATSRGQREAFRAAGAVLSPHIAGPTLDQYFRCGEHALQNIARFTRGEPLQAVVTVADYDRAT